MDIQPIPILRRRFTHIHVDLVGLLLSSNGYTHLLTVIDWSTRWSEAIPLSAMSTKDCVNAVLTSDRGAQFTSEIRTELCSCLVIKHSPTTAYHPQANGMVERYHRQLKDAIRAHLAGVDWYHHPQWLLLGLCSAQKEDCCVLS